MRRFSDDWIDKASMQAMWRAAFRSKDRCNRYIAHCDDLLRSIERVHYFTRRVFNTLANLEEQIYAKARKGKRTIKIRGSFLLSS